MNILFNILTPNTASAVEPVLLSTYCAPSRCADQARAASVSQLLLLVI